MVDEDAWAENWVAQLEEVLALQAIYEDSFTITEVSGLAEAPDTCRDGTISAEALLALCTVPSSTTLIHCQATVEVDVPEGQLAVYLAEEEANGNGGNLRRPSAPPATVVRYLPPLTLHLTFPPTYPSLHPPQFQVVATWLSPSQIALLRKDLQSQWEEQGPGLPVCFTWMQRLQADTLSLLGLRQQLVIAGHPEDMGGPTVPQSAQLRGEKVQVASTSETNRQQTHQEAETSCSVGASSGRSMRGEGASQKDLVSPSSVGNSTRGPGSGRNRGQDRSRGLVGADRNGRAQVQSALSKSEQCPATSASCHQDPISSLHDYASHQPPQDTGSQTLPLPGSKDMEGIREEAPVCNDVSKGPPQLVHHAPLAPEQVLLHLMRYTAAREMEAFQLSTWTCGICFTEVKGSQCLKLAKCGHYYCMDCMAQYCKTLLGEGTVEAMKCPDVKCRDPLAPHVIQQLLSEEDYTRWESLLLQRTLDKMADIFYCPRCNTTCIEDPDHMAQCSNCFFAFCTLCYGSWHPGVKCLSPEARMEMKLKQAARSGSSAEQQRRDLDAVHQMMSLKLVSETSKNCPACGMAIEKTEGCNKMTCGYCGAFFCWQCLQVVDGYQHFHQGSCQMFEPEEIARWNAMMMDQRNVEVYERQRRVLVALRRDPDRLRRCRCPVCGQDNVKEGGNNLIRCWACTHHFCYLCRTWLRNKVGAHFSAASGCKQHTHE